MQLSDLYDDVRREARGAPDFVILDALQRTCAEFFHQSGAWRERFDADALEAGIAEYAIAVPSGAKVARVESVKLADSTLPLTPCTEGEYAMLSSTATAPSPTVYTVSESTGTLLFWPTPDDTVTASFVAVAILVTTREATQLPDTVGERWREGIVSGALKRLLSTPGRPWMDVARAKYHDGCFWDYVARARRESVSGQYVRPLRAQPRAFV